jgi:hypothetical protein
MQSPNIVVSAQGWLLVNPLGVVEPTVGWKRAPLSAIAITYGVIFDKCFTFCILKFICRRLCSQSVQFYEWFEYKTACVVF